MSIMASSSSGLGLLSSLDSAKSIPLLQGASDYAVWRMKIQLAMSEDIGADVLFSTAKGDLDGMKAFSERISKVTDVVRLRLKHASPEQKISDEDLLLDVALADADKKLARVIIMRVNPSIAQHFQDAFQSSPKNLASGVFLLNYLDIVYGREEKQDPAKRSVELRFLDLLHFIRSFPTSKITPVQLVSDVRMRFAELAAIPKVAAVKDNVISPQLESIVASQLLQILGTIARFSSVCEKFYLVVNGGSFPSDKRDMSFLENIENEVLAVERVRASSGAAAASASKSPSQGARPGAAQAAQGQSRGGSRARSGRGGRSAGGNDATPRPPGAIAVKSRVHVAASVAENKQDDAYVSPVSVSDFVRASSQHNVRVSAAIKSMRTLPQAAFLVDSGATHHCVRLKGLFKTFRPMRTVIQLAAGGKECVATGCGEVLLRVVSEAGKEVELVLKDALYVPSMTNNIFSTNAFTAASAEHHVSLQQDRACITVQGGVKVILANDPAGQNNSGGDDKKRLLWLMHTTIRRKVQGNKPSTEAAATKAVADVLLLHRQLGHRNMSECLALARKRGYACAGLVPESPALFCEVCKLAKLKHTAIAKLAARDPKLRPGEIIHMDLKGPLPELSVSGAVLAAVFVDEATRWTVVKEVVSKTKIVEVVSAAFEEFAMAGIHVGENTILHGDSENVLTGREMRTFLASRRMILRSSPPHTHQRNGIAERAIQTLFDTTTAMLLDAQMPKKFWFYAVTYASYIHNRSATTALGGKSPFEVVTGRVPDLNRAEVFGCKVFVRAEERQALDPKARVGVFVGVNESSDSARVLVFDRQRLVVMSTVHCVFESHVSGYAQFAETQEQSGKKKKSKKKAGEPGPAGSDDAGNDLWLVQEILGERKHRKKLQYHVRWAGYDGESDSWEPESFLRETDALRAYLDKKGKVGADEVKVAMAASVTTDNSVNKDVDSQSKAQTANVQIGSQTVSIPKSYSQAMKSEQHLEWAAAIQAEIDALVDNETFETVPRVEFEASGHKLLSTMWVFTVKSSDDDSLPRYKARLVARGDRQEAEIDFTEVYSPVVDYLTLRSMLAIACLRDYDLEQMDAKTAFLNARLEEDIYVEIPQGFQANPGHVLRLSKSLYGLKQAPRVWNEMLHKFLTEEQGLVQSKVDPCLYFVPGKLWVAIWVDDFLIMSADTVLKQNFKQAISAKFKMHDLGPVSRFLGLEIVRDRNNRTLSVTATKQISEMLHNFHMSDCKGAQSPLPSGFEGFKPLDEDETPLSSKVYPYRGIVGSLLYVATLVRPDISFVVSQLARFQERPGMVHWETAKHVLRYLKATQSIGLHYSAENVTALSAGDAMATQQVSHPADVPHGYVDASWGEDSSTRRSQTGLVFKLANAAILWATRLQTTVAQSSTEAEYLALSDAARLAATVRNVLSELLSVRVRTIDLYEDNQSTIKMALNLKSSLRTKHIDIRHHYVKECVGKGELRLHYIPTAVQAADCLTKGVDRVKSSLFRQIILGKH